MMIKMMMMNKKWITGLWIGLMAISGVATAEYSISRNEVFSDWRLICAKGKPADSKKEVEQCNLMQQLNDKSGRQVFKAEILKGKSGSKTEKGILLHLPLGLDLPTKAKLIVGDVKRTLPFQTCLPAGCVVSEGLDRKLMRAMQKANTGTLQIKPHGQSRSVDIKFSLKGFSKGVKEVK